MYIQIHIFPFNLFAKIVDVFFLNCHNTICDETINNKKHNPQHYFRTKSANKLVQSGNGFVIEL